MIDLDQLEIDCEFDSRDCIQFEFYPEQNEVHIDIIAGDDVCSVYMSKQKVDEIIKYLTEIRHYMK